MWSKNIFKMEPDLKQNISIGLTPVDKISFLLSDRTIKNT